MQDNLPSLRKIYILMQYFSLQLSLLAYVHRGEESKDLYKAMICAKILKGFYDDCTKPDHVDAARVRTCFICGH